LRIAAGLVVLLAAGPASGQGEAWERLLPEMAPALAACLTAFAPEGMVVLVVPQEEGRVMARLRRGDGSGLDCVASVRPPAVPQLVRRRVTAEMLAASMGPRAFMLERRCVDAWRVDAPDGRVVGWLAYPQC